LPEKDSQFELLITPETEWRDVVRKICREAPELNHFTEIDETRLRDFLLLRQENMQGEDVIKRVGDWMREIEVTDASFFERRKGVITAIRNKTQSRADIERLRQIEERIRVRKKRRG